MSDESEKLCRDCGTMQVHRRLLDTDPKYARRLERIEEHCFRVTQGMPTMRPGCTKIPVVVHVVYKTAAQNVSQAQIDSQIAVINHDFRKTNADVSTVPSVFSPLAGDARIEFELATTDPDGNATTGVTRTETSANSFNTSDKMKFASSGGHDAWPADEYLNIWVCQMSGGILGYAQFPGGDASTDGVVITHTGFGDTGTAAAPFDKGRTATHEIGHWLNLRHIWGDDGSGCSGSDFVADTPNQGGANIGKPSFPRVSCSNGPNGDMYMNYMDYVDDDTMVMFSEGQIARMQACLDGPRSAIGSSIPCVTIGPKIPFKDGPKEFPKEFVKEFPKDPPKDFGKDGPKDFPKDFGKDSPKDIPKDIPKDLPKDPPKDFGKDHSKDFPKDMPKDIGKEIPKDGPKDIGKEIPKDGPKDFGKDGPKDFGKDIPKDFPKDPGPKNILGDGPQKTIFEPPKSFMEPPIDFPFQPVQPIHPAQPMQPVVPFVLGTGAAPGGGGGAPHAPVAGPAISPQILGVFGQLLHQYAGLHQRGLLDEQGLAAWQQAYAAYQQMGGQ